MLKPVVVCHQLRSGGNLGSICRLMANFGFEALILSEPRIKDFEEAQLMAVEADAVLTSMKQVPTLAEALAECTYVLGTTSRAQAKRFVPLTPEQGVEKLKIRAGLGNVALLLGGEKRGLSDEDLLLCHDVVVIPTPGPQPSMNVAQAAAVMLYLCSRQEVQAAPIFDAAPLKLLALLEEKMQHVLTHAEFLNAQNPKGALFEMKRALVSGQVTSREVQLWISAFEHVKRHLK
jgi:tRNA/rRNA methyltransferase